MRIINYKRKILNGTRDEQIEKEFSTDKAGKERIQGKGEEFVFDR